MLDPNSSTISCLPFLTKFQVNYKDSVTIQFESNYRLRDDKCILIIQMSLSHRFSRYSLIESESSKLSNVKSCKGERKKSENMKGISIDNLAYRALQGHKLSCVQQSKLK